MLVKGKLENKDVEIEIDFEEARRIHEEVQHYYNKQDVTTVLEENSILNYDDKMVSEILSLYEDKLSDSGMWCDIAKNAMDEYSNKQNNI